MCYQLVYLIFDFQAETSLKDNAGVGRCLAQLVADGFHLTDEDMDSPETAWGVALRKGQRSVWVNFENDEHYALTLSVITNNWRRLYLSADRSASGQPGKIRGLVEAGKIIFNTLKPDYGYGLVSLDTQLLDPPGEGDYSISTIYDYNFFSPRLVQKLGADKLDSIMTLSAHSLEGGAMLLEFSPSPLGDRKPYTPAYEAAAEILGVSKIQQGC